MLAVKLAQVSNFDNEVDELGVTRAILLAQQAALDYPGNTYLLGELVPNSHVTAWLNEKYQIKVVKSLAQIPARATLIIKVHGVPPEIFAQAQAKKLRLVDATCPLVSQWQQLVKELVTKQGKQVIFVAASKNHDEAISVSRQVDKGVKVVPLSQLEKLVIKRPDNSVVIVQTSLIGEKIHQQLTLLRQKYPNLDIRTHLCPAITKFRQEIVRLAAEVDVLVVVGSSHSSDAGQLLEIALSTGKKAYLVDTAKQLKSTWFDKFVFVVGVVAGISTPAWITKEVVSALKKIPDIHEGFASSSQVAASTGPILISGTATGSWQENNGSKSLVLGGLPFSSNAIIEGDLDGDVLLQALAAALSSPTLLPWAKEEHVGESGSILDTRMVLKESLSRLLLENYCLGSVSACLSGFPVTFRQYLPVICASVARLLGLERSRVNLSLAAAKTKDEKTLSPASCWCQVLLEKKTCQL